MGAGESTFSAATYHSVNPASQTDCSSAHHAAPAGYSSSQTAFREEFAARDFTARPARAHCSATDRAAGA